ncbi:hypothetical protein F4679DRAFT_567266 [Xylaria curta]|nr:hypothetical protein F4679DRAFT_567266 [Xylaria curta]
MLIASDFLQLRNLEGFVLPIQIPMLHAGQPPGAPHRIVEQEIILSSIRKLISAAWTHHRLWVAPLNIALTKPFWQRIGEESGIAECAARHLLLGLLDARRDYHRQRRAPSQTPRDHVAFLADLLCNYQVDLFRKHGFVWKRSSRQYPTIPKSVSRQLRHWKTLKRFSTSSWNKFETNTANSLTESGLYVVPTTVQGPQK